MPAKWLAGQYPTSKMIRRVAMKFHLSRFVPVLFCAIFVLLVSAGCSSDQEQDPTRQQIGAINALRTQLELPKTPLEFVELSYDGNSPSGSLQVAVYQDTDGRKFFIDPVTLHVVEMDARALLDNISPLASVLSEEDIRAKAQKLIAATIPNFETLRTNWTYEEGGKVDNYFFTWYGEMAAGSSNRPRAQIAIYRTGFLFGYYNTLMLEK
jgi:hypothetical protein